MKNLPNVGQISVPTKAQQKCFEGKLSRRNTVSCARNDGIYASLLAAKNTDYNIFYKNTRYQTVCLYCTDKFTGSLVQHYVKSHSDREVPISRVSPEMSMRIKRQIEIFTKDQDKKISGLCYFCEEQKLALKVSWQR